LNDCAIVNFTTTVEEMAQSDLKKVKHDNTFAMSWGLPQRLLKIYKFKKIGGREL